MEEKNMEDKLKKLFDYQKFENNPNLQIVISKCLETNTSFELSDNELEFAVGGASNPGQYLLSNEEIQNIRQAAIAYSNTNNVITNPTFTYGLYLIRFTSQNTYTIYDSAGQLEYGQGTII